MKAEITWPISSGGPSAIRARVVAFGGVDRGQQTFKRGPDDPAERDPRREQQPAAGLLPDMRLSDEELDLADPARAGACVKHDLLAKRQLVSSKRVFVAGLGNDVAAFAENPDQDDLAVGGNGLKAQPHLRIVEVPQRVRQRGALGSQKRLRALNKLRHCIAVRRDLDRREDAKNRDEYQRDGYAQEPATGGLSKRDHAARSVAGVGLGARRCYCGRHCFESFCHGGAICSDGPYSHLALVLSAPAGAQDIRFVTLDFAPFIYGEDNRVAGPGRDVIAAACDSGGLDCSFDIFPWRRAQELMHEGAADGMMVIGRNAERETWLDFSPPLFRTEYGFFVGAGNTMTFGELAQIAGFRVGVLAPSNTEVQLKALREAMIAEGLAPIEIDPRPDDVSGFRKLAAGRLDAVYSNRDRGKGVLDANGLGETVRYAGADKAILYFAAIRQSFPEPAVSKRFFSALSEIFADGQAEEIIQGYGLEPAPQNPL